ncbi:MAG: 3-hydroxyacyl-CoA dehydrogenase [Rubellimicrobium sp.]|nr:3-hydroxyacyl-CoA dehydrogenase [Rubellimicrobium sp.]
MRDRIIAIIGTGLIGQSWAIAFARAGCTVRLFDHLPQAAARGREDIARTLRDPVAANLSPGVDAATVIGRIHCAQSLAEAVEGAIHVQENTPEHLDVKQRVFAELDAIADPATVLASSSSALLPSRFAAGLAGSARCLVAHPLNPPHLIPAVELVPSPETSADTMARTRALLGDIGQKPVVLNHEIEGFLMNRLQGALLDEAFTLVARGVVSVEDVDTAMSAGLGRRWSFMGPFETIDLNAPGGVKGFIERYGPAYAAIGRERPQRAEWSGDLADTVIAARRRLLPESELAARAAWRDARLAALAGALNDKET